MSPLSLKLTFNRALLLVALVFAVMLLLRSFFSEPSSRSISSDGRAVSLHALPRPSREVRQTGRPVLSRELGVAARERLSELEALATKDQPKALLKLPAFRDTELLDFALTGMSRGWAENDPDAVATWLTQLDSQEDQISAALGLIPVWASRNAEECIDWTLAQPAGSRREVALVEVADAWA